MTIRLETILPLCPKALAAALAVGAVFALAGPAQAEIRSTTATLPLVLVDDDDDDDDDRRRWVRPRFVEQPWRSAPPRYYRDDDDDDDRRYRSGRYYLRDDDDDDDDDDD